MNCEIDKIRNEIKNKKQIKKQSNKVVEEIKSNLKCPKILKKFLIKLLITVVLTLISLIILKSSSNYKKIFYKFVYEKNISFAYINSVYEKYFGQEIPFLDIISNNTKQVFDEKLVYSKAEAFKEGVKLTVSNSYLIPALESGLVVYIGLKEDYGNTVVVQQIDGKDTWYSNIENSNVKLYDYVEKGELLAEASKTTLYLVFKQNGGVLNYEDELN